MVRIIWLMVFMSIIMGVYGQNNPQILNGKIIDSLSKTPIHNVNIRVQNTSSGTTTNINGSFKIELNNIPAVLEISCVGYKKEIVYISRKHFNKELIIELDPQIVQLKEAWISVPKTEVFYKDPEYSVLDYEFIDKNILLLVYKYSLVNQSLIILNPDLDTLYVTHDLPIKGISLYKDCMGNCHLLGSKTAYQIISNKPWKQIDFKYPTDINDFHKNLDPCLFSFKDYLAFEVKRANNLQKSFIAIHTQSKQIKLITRVFDRNKAKAYSEYVREESERLNRKLKEQKDNEVEKNKAFRNYERELNYAKLIAFKPSYTPLILCGDTVILFDHLNNEICLYNEELREIEKYEIDYHKQKNWIEKIYIDEVEARAYTLYKYNNHLKLAVIDTQTGELIENSNIDEIFPEELKVHNGYAWFLHKQRGNAWDRKGLFRVKIQ